ncbi:MAG: hypothetical protein AAF937_05285 [Planctomycetota bacterium]
MGHNATSLSKSDTGLSRLVSLLGITGAAASVAGAPGAGAGAAGVAAIVSHINERRSQRQTERLHQVLESVVQRVERLEAEQDEQVDERTVDLFESYLAKAVQEDDEAKVDLHGGFLTWVLNGASNNDAKILGDAINSLTHLELQKFIRWGSGREAPTDRDRNFDANMFWNRVEAAGLMASGGIKSASNITRLGLVLITHIAEQKLRSDPSNQ